MHGTERLTSAEPGARQGSTKARRTMVPFRALRRAETRDQCLSAQAPEPAVTQFCWMRKLRVPSFTLALEPFDVV
jgi:hypothetical protein